MFTITFLRLKIKKGILLVFILGIISILALIVFTFLTVTSTAQKVLSLYYYQTKSQFAAFSGLEVAYAKMKYNIQKNPIVSITDSFYFKGEITDIENWDFVDINNNTFPDTVAIDVFSAIEPSFKYTENFYLKDGKPFYYSGIVDSTADFVSVYKLKVVDLSSLVSISRLSQGGKNILNNLSKILDYPVFLGDVISNIYISGSEITSFEKIKDALVFPGADVLANFLSLKGWNFPNLVYPNNIPKDNIPVTSGYDYLVKSLQNVIIEERTPLNLNLIHPLLIEANLYNLGANILLDKPEYEMNIPMNISLDEAIKIFNNSNELVKYAMTIGTKNLPQLGYIKNYMVDNSKVKKLVDLIARQRVTKPFDSYKSFNDFMVNGAKDIGLSNVDIDIIEAVINPFLRLQKFNLDKLIKKEVDKTDVVNHTLEFIFFTPGKFVIESAGYVFHKKSMELLAKDMVKATFDAFDIVTLNKQEDFGAGAVSVYDLAKLYYGVTYGPFYHGYRKNRLKKIEKFPGFLHLGLVSNRLTTTDITFCDSFEFSEPDVGQSSDEDFIVFNDGVYSSVEIPFKIPVRGNFPIIDFKDLFGIPYKCDMFKGTFLENACGKISRGTFCFWLKPNYKVVDSSRIRTLVSIQSGIDDFGRTGNINFIDSFIVSFVPKNFIKNLVFQYFPMFAPHTKITVATPFFMWTPKINSAYLSLIKSEEDVIRDGEWTHICLIWDSAKTIERNLGARIFINGEDRTILFGNDYSPDYARMFQYFAPNFSGAKYVVFGSTKEQKYWNFPLEATVDNIVISKNLYTPEEITVLFYMVGRYVNKSMFWQSPEIAINTLQKPLFAYINYIPSDRVSLYIGVVTDNEDKYFLQPFTVFNTARGSKTMKIKIYFDVLNPNEPLLETPYIAEIHLFLSQEVNSLNIVPFDVLMDPLLYRKK